MRERRAVPLEKRCLAHCNMLERFQQQVRQERTSIIHVRIGLLEHDPMVMASGDE